MNQNKQDNPINKGIETINIFIPPLTLKKKADDIK